MRSPRLAWFILSLCVAGLLRAASFESRVDALFRPLLGDMMALSPDGRRVAYTLQTGGDLRIVIMDVEPPGPKRTVKLDGERDAVLFEEKAPVALRFLRWATPGKLVFAPEARVIPLPPIVDKEGRSLPNPDGPTVHCPIMVVDADGKYAGTLTDARDFLETPENARQTLADLLRTPKELAASRNAPIGWRMPHLDVLGFLPNDREQLVLQTRGGHNLPAQYLVDIRTGSVRGFGGDWPSPPGDPQVFDWFRLKVVGERKLAARAATTWRDAELAQVQRELEAKFPRRVVEILDWTDTRARVLVRVSGGSDPGRVFVYQRSEDLVLEILRRAPWLTGAKLHDTRFFEFTGADGASLSGYMTWPASPRRTPPPLLVVFPSGGSGSAQPAFDPEAQVFADLGFAVMRLHHRGAGGLRPEDLTALRTAIDRVSVDDARAAIEWIAARKQPFDPKRVVTLGRGFGGYLAVRALQLHPTVFRCGIAIDAPMELRDWLRSPELAVAAASGTAGRDVPAALLDHAGANWKKLSVLEHAAALNNPLLLLVEPGRNPAVDRSTAELRARVERLGRSVEHLELDAGFTAARPHARAAVYRQIEEFLNLRLNDYAVKIGPAREVQ